MFVRRASPRPAPLTGKLGCEKVTPDPTPCAGSSRRRFCVTGRCATAAAALCALLGACAGCGGGDADRADQDVRHRIARRVLAGGAQRGFERAVALRVREGPESECGVDARRDGDMPGRYRRAGERHAPARRNPTELVDSVGGTRLFARRARRLLRFHPQQSDTAEPASAPEGTACIPRK